MDRHKKDFISYYEEIRREDSRKYPYPQYSPEPKRSQRFPKRTFSFIAGGLLSAALLVTSGMNPFTTDRPAAGSPASNPYSYQANVTTASTAASGTNTISTIAGQSNGAVVLIQTYAKGNGGSRSYDDPFWYFFGNPTEKPKASNDDQLRLVGAGSGFFYKQGGYILTNEHVIANSDQIEVTVDGVSEPFAAKVLGKSADYDLAVLKIESDQSFPVLPIGDSELMNVGDWVVAIGNPLGYDHTVTVGVVSAKGREIPVSDGANGQRQYRNLLQTDAAINSGNSGGPLINFKGEVIGINTAKSTEAQGIGFAIPSSVFVPLISYLEEGRTIPSSYIGVSLQDISDSLMKDLKLSSKKGAMVAQVVIGTPAFQAGIRPYDVIVKMNGQDIQNSKDLANKVLTLTVGEEVTLTVIRDGQEMEFKVTVADKNSLQASS